MKQPLLVLALLLGSVLAYGQAPVTVLNRMPFVIDVRTTWTATALPIDSGQVFSIHVEGLASCSHPSASNHWNWYGPEGWGDYVTVSGFPLNGVPASAVIGKIGNGGTPFFVGKNKTFRAETSGDLYLGYNDSEYWDNFGYFVAFVDTAGTPIGVLLGANTASATPAHLKLSQNYPNPFNPSTTISYVLPSRANVGVQIFDMSGRLVKALVSEEQESGLHTAVWNGQDQAGHPVSSGTYFYRVDSDGRQLAKKMLLLK